MDKKFAKGTVVENKHWTKTLYSLKVDAEINPFTPGQFGRLALDIDGKTVARPYSFVNGADEPHHEFYSIAVPGGLLSERLHALKEGDAIGLAKAPAGFFTLSEVPEGRTLWMLSTGTAIGPFLSILKGAEVWQRFEHIVLAHAVRYAEELSYSDTIDGFAAQYKDQFSAVRFVSREDMPDTLPGRIPAAIESGKLEETTGVELINGESQVMICGNPDMVKDTTEILKQRDFTKNRRREPGNITTENYW